MEFLVSAKQKEALAAKCADLEEQLEQAKLERIKAASADGDKSENTSLDIAEKILQSVEAQLREARDQYSRAKVVESVSTDAVGILTTVEITDLQSNTRRTIDIVADGQGGPPNKISCHSKLGNAIIGCAVGEEFSYQDNTFRTHRMRVESISAGV